MSRLCAVNACVKFQIRPISWAETQSPDNNVIVHRY